MIWNTRYANDTKICDCKPEPATPEEHTHAGIKLIRSVSAHGGDVTAPDEHIDYHFRRGSGEI